MSKRPPLRWKDERHDGTFKIVAPFGEITPRREPGRPPGPSPKSLDKAERAAAYVLEQQAKRPNARATPLIDHAAADFHVSPPRVREALKALRNKEKSRL
ncbi:MAG TPA: hypothetical protein VIF88_04310 [Methylocystis sp.]|jgi:hypothetical protein